MKNLIPVILAVLLISIAGCSADKEEMKDSVTSSNQENSIDGEIINVVDLLYKSIEYKPDEDIVPDWDLMRSLFIEDANLIHVGDTSYVKMKVQDFIDGYDGQITAGIIEMASEYEIFHTGDQYGKIAQVFSTYELEGVYSGEQNRKRGINSIQLMKVDNDWKVSSIIWYDENEANPIPSEYLSIQ